MKYINFKSNKFSTVVKKFNFKRYAVSKIYKFSNFGRYNLQKFKNSVEFRKINFLWLKKFLQPKNFSFQRLRRIINYKKYKVISFYFVSGFFLILILYLSIPKFFNYNNLLIENTICKDLKIKCSVTGKVKYSFIPLPNLKVNNIVVQDFEDSKKIFANIEQAKINLSLYNLLKKEKFIFKQIYLKGTQVNLNLSNLAMYKNFAKKKFNLIPIKLENGEIELFNNSTYLLKIKNANINYKYYNDINNVVAKGEIFNQEFYFSYKESLKDNKKLKNFLLKLKSLNLLSKVEIDNSEKINGKFKFKQSKNQLLGTFGYENNKIVIKNMNLKNIFLEGKSQGIITLYPFFNFDINIDLNSINFNRMHSLLLKLDTKRKAELFKFSKKINGQLSLSVNKIFSKNNLIDSFESRLRFKNGNILVDSFLFNMPKLGAGDFVGTIQNEDKISKLKFESNLFIDNLNNFYNKFGIYNKGTKDPFTMSILGEFDFVKLSLFLNDISGNQKFENYTLSNIEKEFNETLLIDGYESLFNYRKFKTFIKDIAN